MNRDKAHDRISELYADNLDLIQSNPWHPDIIERLETAAALRVALDALRGEL